MNSSDKDDQVYQNSAARQLIQFKETVLENEWCRQKPHPKQAKFLLLPHREALFGGAGSGGKSSALLMAASQFVKVPGYAALLLRRTYEELKKADALIDRSKRWWYGHAHWHETDMRWTFPSGATVSFGYLERNEDALRYDGAAFQFIGFDELQHHTEWRYTYLFSRLRRLVGSDVPVRMRSSAMPGGPHMAWVKKRFLDEPHPDRAFVPARRGDNPSLDQADYSLSLVNLDPITRRQIEEGDWSAAEGGRFKREWFGSYKVEGHAFGQGGTYQLGETKAVPVRDSWNFVTCDPAASGDQAKGKDPDYTAVCAWAVTPQYDLIWLDCHRFRLETPDIVPQIQSVCSQWDARFAAIEAVAANRAVLQEAMRTPMAVRAVSPGGRDKLVRATKAMTLAKSGRVWLPERAPWLEEARSEILMFTGLPGQGGHDDIVDNLSYATELLGEYDEGPAGMPLLLKTRGA